MLSLDFTDRQIKIVRGSLAGSKIRVIQVETLTIPVGLIENGFIADVPMLASELLEFFRTNDIKEKEIIAEIGSGLILHKELILPKPKNLKNSFVIETMIQSNMNLNTDYNISFNIAEELEDENKNPMIRVLATAVPQRLVDGYTRLFSHLGLTLKSLYVSSSCINRLVENSQKLISQMPLMMVQVEYDFISINLYDDGRVVFSRRVSIDAEEINGDSDALVQAVYDNVFRMIQFLNSRKNSKPLKEITFYGRIPDFILLTNAMSSFNTSTHVLSAPGNVVSFCEFDFAEYANAVSAFFKSKHEYDRIDLLKASAAKEKKPTSFYGLVLVGSLIGAAAIVAGAYFLFNVMNNDLISQKSVIEAEINSPEIQNRVNTLNAKIERLNGISLYSDNITVAKYLFDFQPTIVSEIEDKLLEVMPEGVELTDTLTISGYSVSASFIADADNKPSEYVQALEEQGYFENISYSGYEGRFPMRQDDDNNNNNANNNNNNADEDITYYFSISMLLKGGNAYEVK